MIPIGYLYKRVVPAAPAVASPGVVDIYSVSSCINEDFAEYVTFWRHSDDVVPHWAPFEAEASVPTHVVRPEHCVLEGFDVVTFSSGNSPEHSPLSCDGLADELPVNAHCLLASFDEAFQALEQGTFTNSEPGPYRILAVYRVHEAHP